MATSWARWGVCSANAGESRWEQSMSGVRIGAPERTELDYAALLSARSGDCL